MRIVRFTPRARDDLIDIWEFIARNNFDAADRVIAAVDDATKLLAIHAGIGHTRVDVTDKRYRFWRVYSYLLAYRATDTELIIVRVLHGARDLRHLLNQETP